MKALVIDGYGLENVKIADVPDPEAVGNQVVVRLEAAALNHLDLWTAKGSLPITHEFPHVLGADGAGTVETVGPDAKSVKAGDRVVINPGLSCGACELCRRGEQSTCTTFQLLGEHVSGTFAERVVVPDRNVFPIPEHLSFQEAAALGVTMITAYRMLFTRGGLKPGEWILITGVGGGLGLSLLQLAAPVAGRIIVTSSTQEKIDRAVSLGADAGVNYKEEEVTKRVRALTFKRGVDLVVDSAGGDALTSGIASLRKGGRLVSSGATAGATAELDVRRLFWNQLSVIGSTMGADEDVGDMLRMVHGAKLKPIIDKVFSLDEGPAALQHLAAEDRFGKVVLDIP